MFWEPPASCDGDGPVLLIYAREHDGKILVYRTVGYRVNGIWYPDRPDLMALMPILYQRLPDIPHELVIRWHAKLPAYPNVTPPPCSTSRPPAVR